MKFFYLSLVSSLFCGHIAAFPAQGAGVHNLHRSTETCGDPSVATTFFEGFKPSVDSHALDTMDNFITLEAGADVWNIDGPSFRAWISASQANTTPLYWLYNSKTHDYVYLTSATAAPPTRSGYESAKLRGYVYSTQICNSVPLYCVSMPSDHWYTTDIARHNNLVNKHGWSDCGITAYVLPIDDVSQVLA